MRFVCRIVRSVWNLTATSAALLPMCLSNFKVMRQFILPISRLRDDILQWDVLSHIRTVQGFRFDSDSIPATDGRMISTENANSASTPAHGTRRKKAMHQINHRKGGGGTRTGFIRGCAAPGSEPLPYFRESRTPKTYPILGKSHNPGYPKRSGLQKHTLF